MLRRAAGDPSLKYLLELDGEEIHYDHGYVARFRAIRVEATKERPHGVSYLLTFHGPDGKRVNGYDNAHGVSHRGSRFGSNPVAHDHWHRDEKDPGRPYMFVDAEKLISEFFDKIERMPKERGQW